MTPLRPTEFELIAKYFAPLSAPNAFGLLDDAAIVTPPAGHDLVITKDMLVAGIHFFEADPPEAIAAKALRVNLSDLAAKGATPLGFMLGLALPENWQPEWVERFATGLGYNIETYNCPLYGGDTVRASGGLTLSITAFGTVPTGKMVRRTTMQVGDSIYVSGTIGDSALGLKIRKSPNRANLQKQLKREESDYLLNRYLLPQPRVELSDAILRYASACMDVSDGFIGDLTKMLNANTLCLSLDAISIPLSKAAKNAVSVDPELLKLALTGGDDYELLVAVPPDDTQAFEQAVKKLQTPVKYLGVAKQAESVTLEIRDKKGLPIIFNTKSYTHF